MKSRAIILLSAAAANDDEVGIRTGFEDLWQTPDDALKALAALDERKSRVVELRFFGGLSVDETAEVLKVSADTVMRDWKLAKVWLLGQLSEEQGYGT